MSDGSLHWRGWRLAATRNSYTVELRYAVQGGWWLVVGGWWQMKALPAALCTLRVLVHGQRTSTRGMLLNSGLDRQPERDEAVAYLARHNSESYCGVALFFQHTLITKLYVLVRHLTYNRRFPE